MKKDSNWWYVLGIAGGVAGFVGAAAWARHHKKSQTKGEIIRTILTNQNWCVSKIHTAKPIKIEKQDTWSFFDNGMVLNLGNKEKISPEQKEYTNMGSWTLIGKLLETRWQGPTDHMAYKWMVEVLRHDKIRLQNVLTDDIVELIAFPK